MQGVSSGVSVYAALLVAVLAILTASYFVARRFGRRRWLFLLSAIAWAVVVGSVGVNALWVRTFAEVGRISTGCYLTDALWFYVQCNGFHGAALAGSMLTLPYILHPQALLLAPFITIPLWVLLVYPAAYWRSNRSTDPVRQ